MAKSVMERELKFTVGPGFVIPPLDPVLPEGGRVEQGSQQLRSDYFDTPDHALLQVGITLRRRTGTSDACWQLKVPNRPFRKEIQVPLDQPSERGRAGVPDDLAALLLGRVRDQTLVQVATIVTDRAVTRLVDHDGALLAEIADDQVRASAGGETATATRWREVEIELGAGNDERQLLDALDRLLRHAGAQPSDTASELARALSPPHSIPPPRTAKHTAGDLVARYVAEQQGVLLAGDLGLRSGEETVIHPTRVATRRLRSTLRTFRRFVDSDRAARLDGELRWYASLLGQVRDRQVLRRRLDAMVAGLDGSLLLGPVKARIDTELQTEQAEHWQRLQTEITGPRYLALLADLGDWVDNPPHTPAADRPARAVLKPVARSRRRVKQRLDHANASGDVDLLHPARKAAKRARYAAEAAEPVTGRKTSRRRAKGYQRLQDHLGEHQDSLLSATLLRRLGAKAGTTRGENGFSFGILYEREQRSASLAQKKARRAARKST